MSLIQEIAITVVWKEENTQGIIQPSVAKKLCLLRREIEKHFDTSFHKTHITSDHGVKIPVESYVMT